MKTLALDFDWGGVATLLSPGKLEKNGDKSVASPLRDMRIAGYSRLMRKFISGFFLLVFAFSSAEAALPFSTVFRGRDKFERLVSQARAGNWSALPIGERTA